MIIGIIVFIIVISLIGYIFFSNKPSVGTNPPTIPPVYIKPDRKDPDAPTTSDIKKE